MKSRLSVSVIGLLAWLAACPVQAFDDTAVVSVKYPPWFKPTFYELRDDLDEADAAGKRGLLLFFSTQGCSYCRLMLENTFTRADLAQRLQDRYDVIGLEMFDDTEIIDWSGATLPVKDFAVREGAQFSPTLVFYDLRRARPLRLVGYYDADRLALVLDYLQDAVGAEQGLKQWLARRATADQAVGHEGAYALRSDSLFEAPPYRFDRSRRSAERPLLVIFEQRHCADCDRFHREVLGDPDVRNRLAGFEVARLDGSDAQTPVVTPSGATTTAAEWLDLLGFSRLPALVLFDENGTRVLQTDAQLFKGRFLNALGYVVDRAYAKGWTYQRYARSEGIRRHNEGGGSHAP